MTLTEFAKSTRPFPAFQTSVSIEGASSVVAFRGEADICTLHAVIAELAEVVSGHDGPVIVDLADTTFIDLGTVRAIGGAARFLSSRDRTLTVRHPSRMALRLLAFLGLSDLVEQNRVTAA